MSRSVKYTTCNRDCPDGCRIEATLEGDRVVRLRGDPNHPVTRGFLCERTTLFLRRQYAPDRLQTPLLRRGGRLVPVSWDEALGFAAERLLAIRAESGPAAIFHYRGGGSLGLLKPLSDLFFDRFGPCTTKRGDICSGASEAAQEADLGVSESSDFFDVRRSRNVILWGKNVYTSSPHRVSQLRQARGRGAGVALIDPAWQRTARLCDLYVQPRPGCDLALAMGVARALFERGWVHPDAADWCEGLAGFRALAMASTIEAWCEVADVAPSAAVELARRLGPGAPCKILVGWGLGRRLHGGATTRALDALGAITGNLGVPGGGVSFYFRRRRGLEALFDERRRPPPRTVCEPLFGQEILAAREPPIRAVWITAANPVAMLPDAHANARALASCELVVVVDSDLTDTAALADLVLPTTTLLEDDDLLGAYGHHWLGVARPVVAPPEGVRSDLEILQGLAGRVGLGDVLAGDARAWQIRLLAPELAPAGITLEALEAGPVRNPLAPQVLFEGRRFPTASGKVHLVQALPELAPLPAGALTLLSVSTPRSQSSQWIDPPQPGPVELRVHPQAAAGIPHGGRGRLRSALGTLEVRVLHDPRQRSDVALVPKGGHLRLGQCANAIIRARLTDLGEGGALYDEPVRLEPIDGP